MPLAAGKHAHSGVRLVDCFLVVDWACCAGRAFRLRLVAGLGTATPDLSSFSATYHLATRHTCNRRPSLAQAQAAVWDTPPPSGRDSPSVLRPIPRVVDLV